MPSKLLFTAAVVAGGLLVGGVGAAVAPGSVDARPPVTRPTSTPNASTPAARSGMRLIASPTLVDGTAPNDDFADARDFTASPMPFGWVPSAAGATTEAHEPLSFDGSKSGHVVLSSVWAKWTAGGDGTLSVVYDGTIDRNPNSAYAVFTGKSMATAKRIAFATSDDGGDGSAAATSVPVKKGVTYHIQFSSTGAPGTTPPTDDWGAQLDATVTPPANDAKGQATVESGAAWSAQGAEYGATIESVWESIGSGGDPRATSVWYRWTALADGDLSSTFNGHAGGSEYLAVFQRNVNHNLVQVGYGATTTKTSQVFLPPIPVNAGLTYYFAAGTFKFGKLGRFSLSAHATYTGPAVTSVSPSSGKLAGGTRVTITGTRLSNTIAVYFGQFGVTNLKRISSTKVQVTVPAGVAKGAVNVLLQAGEHSSAVTGKSRFTYK